MDDEMTSTRDCTVGCRTVGSDVHRSMSVFLIHGVLFIFVFTCSRVHIHPSNPCGFDV